MTLPRVLSMGAEGVMHIEPAEELNTLRKNPRSLTNIDVPAQAPVVAEGIQGGSEGGVRPGHSPKASVRRNKVDVFIFCSDWLLYPQSRHQFHRH